MLLGSGFLWAQTARNQIEVDYTHPKTYVVGGVSVEGNQYINQHQILQLSDTIVRDSAMVSDETESLSEVSEKLNSYSSDIENELKTFTLK